MGSFVAEGFELVFRQTLYSLELSRVSGNEGSYLKESSLVC